MSTTDFKLISALEDLFKNAESQMLAREDLFLHEVLQHFVAILIAVDHVARQKHLSILKCRVAKRLSKVIHVHFSTFQSHLRVLYLLDYYIDDDLDKIDWEDLLHDEVNDAASKLSFLAVFLTTICALCIFLVSSIVKHGDLLNHLIANLSDLTDQVLVIVV